jgi:hypothetical protein
VGPLNFGESIFFPQKFLKLVPVHHRVVLSPELFFVNFTQVWPVSDFGQSLLFEHVQVWVLDADDFG